STVHQLHMHPAYLGSAKAKSLPYKLGEMVGKDDQGNDLVKVSAFRALTDAMTSVGNHRLAIDKNYKMTGEYAGRSNETSKDFVDMIGYFRAAIYEHLALNPQQDRLKVETVEEVFT